MYSFFSEGINKNRKKKHKKLENQCLIDCKALFATDTHLTPEFMNYFNDLRNKKTKIFFINKLNQLLKDTKFIEHSKQASDIHKFYYFFREVLYTFDIMSPECNLWLDRYNKIHISLLNLFLHTIQYEDFHKGNVILYSMGEQNLSPFIMLMLQFSRIGEICYLLEFEWLKALAEKGTVDFNEHNNKWGNTIFHFLISNAEPENCIRFISILNILDKQCKCGLNINLLSSLYGTSALQLTVAKGYRNIDSKGNKLTKSFIELSETLLNSHADINLKSAKNLSQQHQDLSKCLSEQTALHSACARRDFEFIQLLMRHGADPAIKNGEGLTPLEVIDLSFDKRQAIVDNISGKGLNNLTQYEKEHSSESHIKACKEAVTNPSKDTAPVPMRIN